MMSVSNNNRVGANIRIKDELVEERDLWSAIECSLLLDQLTVDSNSNINTNMKNPDMSMYNNTSLLSVAPPCYGSNNVGSNGPAVTPFTTPYQTPFQTPSASPLSSVQSSPVVSRGDSPVARSSSTYRWATVPSNFIEKKKNADDHRSVPAENVLTAKGIDDELAMILECDPFIWDREIPNTNGSLPQQLSLSSDQRLTSSATSHTSVSSNANNLTSSHVIQESLPYAPRHFTSILSSSLNLSACAEDRVTGPHLKHLKAYILTSPKLLFKHK